MLRILLFAIFSVVGTALCTSMYFNWRLTFLREKPVLSLLSFLVNCLTFFVIMVGFGAIVPRLEAWVETLANRISVSKLYSKKEKNMQTIQEVKAHCRYVGYGIEKTIAHGVALSVNL